jgi:hypothetical protein
MMKTGEITRVAAAAAAAAAATLTGASGGNGSWSGIDDTWEDLNLTKR